MSTHESATLTADLVLFSRRPNGRLYVLLVEREREPFAGSLALPGGRVDRGETFRAAAHRELTEETGLTVQQITQVGYYDDPDRDSRGRVVTIAFAAMLDEMPAPTAGDDARTAQWLPVTQVLADPDQLAFDHAEILRDAMAVMAGQAAATVTNTNVVAGNARVGQQTGVSFQL